MKQLPLTQNKFALVDDADYEWLNHQKWCADQVGNNYYACFGKWKKSKTRMHRLILGLKIGDKQAVDHINGNTLDNRRCNLRLANHSQNGANRKISRGISKYKGVYYDKQTNKWRATIGFNKKVINIGRFKEEIDAAKAYDKKAIEIFGEFAYTNF